MFSIHRKELTWGGRPLVIETGRLARQADGAVLVTYGETTVLCTAVAQKEPRPGVDFFPLTVNYQEKAFAAGRIPGGFFKREGRPSEKETLTSRLIDRPVRPLFANGFRNETQVICTVLSHDLENDPDIPALVGTSAALTISGIPFLGPIFGARVGYVAGEYVLNPRIEELENSTLDMVVAGTADAVLMVESEAQSLSEEEMLGAVMFAQRESGPVIDAIISLAEDCAKEPWALDPPDPARAELEEKVREVSEAALRQAYAEQVKQTRVEKIANAKAGAQEALAESYQGDAVAGALKTLEKDIVRNAILDTGERIDGRDTRTVRPIQAEVGILPRLHGSALFTRGETQALVVATLGTGQDEQIIDALEGEYREHFLLHYNFPPYSVGEASFLRAPGRREIGHGKLAWRAVRAMMPSKDDFPYTVRVVSEITESNGSSSMATVCGTSLAMMDAGVPIKAPVAGIAMGLIKEGDRFAVLSDILGDEDHLGDMDFKVAGTRDGVTALQMDIKITGITEEIMRAALEQARDGRLPHPRQHGQRAFQRARGDQRACAQDHRLLHPARQDPRGHRHGRQGNPRDLRGDRCQDRHRGRRHHQGRGGRFRRRGQGDRVDPRHRRRTRGRRDLRRQGGQGGRFRRLRELPRRPRRAGPYQRAGAAPRRQGDRRGQRGRRGEGQGAGHRRPGQGPPFDEGGRPGNRRGHFRQAGGPEGGGFPGAPERAGPADRAGLSPSGARPPARFPLAVWESGHI